MKSYKPLISDSIFIILTSAIIWFAFKKIQSYVILIQTLQPELQNIEQTLLTNTSEFSFNALSLNLDIISQISTKIQIITITAILAIFIIFCITQSFSFIRKFNLRYLKKFIIISVPYFIILIFLIFKTLTTAKEFIVLFWFENQTNTALLITIIILTLITLTVMHIFSLTASYLIKNNIKTTIKKALRQLRNHKLTLKFLAISLLIMIMSIISIRYFPLIMKVLSIIIILMIVNYYRNLLPK